MKLRSTIGVGMAVLVIGANAAAATRQQEQSLKVIHQVAPVYPEAAKRARVEGKVVPDVSVE